MRIRLGFGKAKILNLNAWIYIFPSTYFSVCKEGNIFKSAEWKKNINSRALLHYF